MSTTNPFKGPKSYEDGDKFYGRKKEIKEIYNLIRSESLAFIFSRSGTGKTSLLKAGLLPFLREELNFLPVYIHLNASAVKKSHAVDLSHYVIECCREQIEKHLLNRKDFKVSSPPNIITNSLFEFIHNLRLGQVVRTEPETAFVSRASIVEPTIAQEIEYSIKPVLIFDQLEEIFTLPFEVQSLQFLLNEVKCLLDDQIPEYLDKTFTHQEDQRYLKLKNALMSKQRNFRIVFSFREEYLPQFESLQSELPAIKYTSSRYRLEPFSVPTAVEVILKTEPGISENAAHMVSENLAVNILSNFEKIAVEPFLLSLVCQKIYREILEHKAGEHQATADKIKKLVNEAIEVFINDVYDSIDDNTKEFIENKLVTSDNKRTPFNYTEATKDPQLKKDIDKLTTDPERRLLNLEQFLDSLHIELLHDRLLPPIAKRRAERQKQQEAEAFKARQTELENQYKEEQNKREEFHRMRRKKQRLLLLLYLALAATIILVVIAYSITREREDKGKLADIFGKQTIAHITNLQQTEPFITLALAHSNYHRLNGMGLADSITQEFEKIFVETYKGHLFNKELLGFYAATLSKKNSLALASLKNESTEYPVLLLYNLADLTPAPKVLHNDSAIDNVLLAMENDTDHLSGENLKYSVNTATKQGFSDEEDFIYAIVKIQDSSFLKIWAIKPRIDEKPIWIEDLTPLNLVSPKIFAKGGKVAILTRIKNKYLVNSFDIQGKKRMNYEVKVQNGLEEVEDVSFTNRSIITVEKDESGKVSRYRIYSKKKSWQAVAFHPPEGEPTALTYYAGDSLSYVSRSKSETYVGFVDAAGNAVGDTVKLPSHDASVLYIDSIYILYYNAGSLEGQKRTNNTWQPMLSPKIRGNADQKYISFSQDKKMLAVTYAPRSIAVFDMPDFHLIDKFQVPEPVRNEPVFDAANRNLITVNGKQVYTHYFRKNKNIATVHDLEDTLQKTTRFGKAWPISDEEKNKYDIEDDLQDTVKHRH